MRVSLSSNSYHSTTLNTNLSDEPKLVRLPMPTQALDVRPELAVRGPKNFFAGPGFEQVRRLA